MRLNLIIHARFSDPAKIITTVDAMAEFAEVHWHLQRESTQKYPNSYTMFGLIKTRENSDENEKDETTESGKKHVSPTTLRAGPQVERKISCEGMILGNSQYVKICHFILASGQAL